MNREAINNLLDNLDSTINSNAFWLEFGVPAGEFDLSKTLVQHLKTRSFHFKLVIEDINREWNHYSEMVFRKNLEEPLLLQMPGKIWNGQEEITFNEITKEVVKEHLVDLLTGGKKYYSKSSLGTQISVKEANAITSKFIDTVSNESDNWNAYLIKPNFLNTVDDAYESGYTKLGYFEEVGRDMVMAFLNEDELCLLMTNGYS